MLFLIPAFLATSCYVDRAEDSAAKVTPVLTEQAGFGEECPDFRYEFMDIERSSDIGSKILHTTGTIYYRLPQELPSSKKKTFRIDEVDVIGDSVLKIKFLCTFNKDFVTVTGGKTTKTPRIECSDFGKDGNMLNKKSNHYLYFNEAGEFTDVRVEGRDGNKNVSGRGDRKTPNPNNRTVSEAGDIRNMWWPESCSEDN